LPASIVEVEIKTQENKTRKTNAEKQNRCHSELGGTPGEEPAFLSSIKAAASE
jgi:hypothetical protein